MKSIRNYILILTIGFGVIIPYSCSKTYLDRPALGALSADVLANSAGVNGLLIGAYAALDGQDMGSSAPWSSSVSNWIYGSVAGGDAHKGSDATDQPPIIPIANFNGTPDNPFFNDKWISVYEGISRCNNTLKVLSQVKNMDPADTMNIAAQARFLRGHFYFDLKRMYNMVPWIDENTTDFIQKNDQDIWPNIEADFQFAFDNLPATQPNVGAANKWAAAAYLGKTYVYEKKWQDAKTILDQVIAQGQTSKGIKYGLLPSIEDNFRPELEVTSPEAVFPVEMAANVGTGSIDNASYGEMLNFPYGDSPFGCCGFFQPTQDLVNSYRTDANGLPYLDTYNTTSPVKNDQGILSTDPFTPDAGNLDPRLDWTAGRRGLPYLDWGIHPGAKWIRDQNYSGPYAPLKNIYWQSTEGDFHDAESWAPGSAINYLVIRFADVLLLAAEADAQLNLPDDAEALVNQVRNRTANNPAGWVHKYINDADPTAGFSATLAANYKISPYPAGAFASQAFALKAIYFERKLELAMEGHRFFDLSRWGIAEPTLNAFFAYEGNIGSDIKGGHFTANKNEYFPIPQNQIDNTVIHGAKTLTQNPGYQ